MNTPVRWYALRLHLSQGWSALESGLQHMGLHCGLQYGLVWPELFPPSPPPPAPAAQPHPDTPDEAVCKSP
ncbi:hypothetical protein ACG0Z6_06030 [Roseateles sp. BYS180W]|uniref:Uncharacterized protein n=1 Tax=Roseateles rivi TaxID=3299028 RepID=A0ABW7FU23_9BURK